MNSFFQKITTIGAVCALSFAALAQPTWNRVDYTATMAFIGEVRINQYDAAFPRMVQAGDYIGAFVGNECRMTAKIVSYNSALYVSSVIHGGDVFLAANSGELLEFKLWNSTTNAAEPATIKGTLLSKPNDEILTYIIGKPNENTEVLSFGVANRPLSPAFSNTQKNYAIEFEAGAKLPSLADVSLVLADSRAKYDVSLPTNFTNNNKLIVTVTAEDGTTKSVFTITCTQSACTATAPIISTQKVNLCMGNAATSLANYAYGTNLKWYDGETLLPAAPTPSTAATGVKTYFVTQTTNCESPRATVTVEVFAKPTVSIVAANEVCANGKIPIQLLPAGGIFSGPGTVYLSEFFPSSAAIGLQTMTYTYTDANNCSNTATATITIKNCTKPTITIVDKKILTIGEVYVMEATLTPADETAQVLWSVNNPATASIDRNTGEITGLSFGMVKVTAQLAGSTESSYVFIQVVPQPAITGVTVNSAGTEVTITFSDWIKTTETVIFDIQIYNGTQQYTVYKATVNQNMLTLQLAEPIEDIANVKIKYEGTSISSKLGALVPSFERPILATSIATVDNQLFTLYPTIASDIVSIETSAEVDNVMIVNSQGQLILAQRATAPLTQIPVAHLAQGTYSVVAFSKNHIVGTARFVKK